MRNIACTIILLSSLNAVAQTSSSMSLPQAPATAAPAAVAFPEPTQQTAPPTAANTIKTNVVPGLLNVNPNKFFGALSVGYNSNLYERNTNSSVASTSADAVLNYRANKSNVIRGYVGGSQEQTQGKESHLNDGFVALVNDGFWKRGPVSTIGQQVRLIVPMSRESVKRDERITGVTVAPTFVFNMTPVGLTGVMLVYQPAGTKNFHKYEVNRAYRTNNEFTLSHLFRAIWSFTDKAFFLSDFVYRNSWSYGGISKDPVSSYSVSLGYNVSDAFSLSAGVSTDATIRNFENGADQNIQLFNQKTSSIFLGLTYVF
jgi:hypothetical protein